VLQKKVLEKNKAVETRIIHEYEKIPSDVRNYSKDELRRQVTDFKPE
jgi:hypothetical protein